MIRCFIAFSIPAGIRNYLYNEAVTLSGASGLRIEKEDKIHLTLKFIGDVDESKLKKINESLAGLSEYKEIEMKLDKFSFFYRDGKPSIFKAGLIAGQGLQEIVSFVEDEMANLGFKKETRKFIPHLTLARIKNSIPMELVEKIENFRPEEKRFKGNSIVLYQSTLTPGGSIYKEIKKYSLKPLEE